MIRADHADNRAPWWSCLVRPKGNIGLGTLAVLSLLGGIPLILALCRLLSMPGAIPPTVLWTDPLVGLGSFLNDTFSLLWVPPDDRQSILYLLLLPTGALLVAVARLTFGLRVLGLRVVLIAIAFQEIGLLPSLTLMAVVIGVVMAVRPSMRRIRLPRYARTCIIVCIAATVMVAALFIGPMAHSQTIWQMAFFPVIIMAMLAESMAKTLANDNAILATWRLSWTLVMSLLIAVVGQIAVIQDIALGFPELLLTQLVLIVFIAEFLDFRLLEHWPERLNRLASGDRLWNHDMPKVAVVRNRWNNGLIDRLGTPAPERYRKRSVQGVVDALRRQGFQVRVLEGDMNLPGALRDFLPPDARTGTPGGIVFNLGTGVQGEGRFCQVPALLEMAGIAYTGPDPVVHAHLSDRYVLLSLLQRADVPVPRFSLMSRPDQESTLRFPLWVRPRHDADASPIEAGDARELEKAVAGIIQATDHEALIEEATQGRDIRVGLIGNETIESLPLVERTRKSPRNRCPAQVTDEESWRIREAAFQAYEAVGGRDYARVDVSLSADGDAVVTDLQHSDVFARQGSFATAAEAGGLTFDELLCRIVDVAWLRYAPTVMTRAWATPAPSRSSVVWLQDRREIDKPTANQLR